MSDIKAMEGARDVQGLVRALGEKKPRTVQGESRGAAARGFVAGFGIELPEGADVHVLDFSRMQVVDDNAQRRADAAHALGRLYSREGLEALAAALTDDVPLVRQAVVEALVAVGGHEMRSALSDFEEKEGMERFDAMVTVRTLVQRLGS